MSEATPEPEDERGYWTIMLEGGPALAGNLATALRLAGRQRTLAGDGFTRLADALDRATFISGRRVEIHAAFEPPSQALRDELAAAAAEALADEAAGDDGLKSRVATLERQVGLLLRTALAKGDVTTNDVREARGLLPFVPSSATEGP